MVPEEEEEYENFSDDEISLDVPVGSPNSLQTFNGSMTSIQKKIGSIQSSTDSLNSFQSEQSTNLHTHEDAFLQDELEEIGNETRKLGETNKRTEKNDNLADEITQVHGKADNSEYTSIVKEIEDLYSTAYKNNESESKQRASNSNIKDSEDKEGERLHVKELSSEDRTTKSQDGTNADPGNKHIREISDTGLSRHSLTKHHTNPASQQSDTEDETNQSDDTDKSNTDDNDSDDTDSNTRSEDRTTESKDGSNADSFSDEHWEELGVDEDVFQDIMHHVADSDAEIAIEVLKVGNEGLQENDESDKENNQISNISDYSRDNITATQQGKYENKNMVIPDIILKSEVSISKDTIPHKAVDKNTKNFENGMALSPCPYNLPSTLVLQVGERIVTTQTLDHNKNTKDKCDIQENDRGVSVSNIVLDSKTASLTPTIEFSKDLIEETEENERSQLLPTITDIELVNSRETITDPISPQGSLKDPDKDEVRNERSDELTLLKTINIPDSGGERELSPVSDIEYDYNKRRGSYLKIKLEGRRRQRLSISESEPSKSPTEAKEFENEVSDGHIVRLPNEPLLDKRQKMDQISLTNHQEKTATVSSTSTSPVNAVVDISDTQATMPPYDAARSKNEDNNSDGFKFPESVHKAESRPVKDINSLNADLIAIYNSSSTEKVEGHNDTQQSRQPRKSTVTAQKQKEEEYFEGYHLLKSCNQTHTTQSFVTDINQMIVKTRKQSTLNTEGLPQDFNSDSISNNADTDNKGNNKNNCETKSLLLPNSNETGNCLIKASEKCAIKHDSLSHNCEHGQLSLRQNGHKNNEINEPNSSIEQSPSQNQPTKIKKLRKRQSYENLLEKKLHNASFLRHPPETETVVQLQPQTGNKPLITSRADSQLSTLPICSKPEKSAKSNSKVSVHSEDKFVKQNDSPTGSRCEKGSTGSGNSKMSARILRSREEQRELAGYTDREMSARLHRTQSALTDTARLRSIRKLLNLTDDNDEKPEQVHSSDQETNLIIQDIIGGIIKNVCSVGTRQWQTAMKTHRCTTTDDDGEEILCCLLQTSSLGVDPSTFTCDVIDPVDVCPVTKKHEHLVSNIVRIGSHVSRKFKPEEELMVNLPISHWYVEPWQELVIRQQDGNGHWKDASNQTTDIVKIDDVDKVYYGVRHFLSQPCSLSVVSRPKVTSVFMANYKKEVNAVIDDRVKMHVFASSERKFVSMQVVPIGQPLLSKFYETEENKKACVIVAASPLLQISVSHNEPESLAFDVPYVSVYPPRPDTKSSINRSSSPYLRTSDQGSRESTSQSLLSPYLSPAQSPRGAKSPRRLSDASPIMKGDSNQLAFHLAQLDDDDEVKVKLLGSSDTKTIDIVTGQIEEPSESDEQTVKFSVYDKAARLVALQTKGSLEYSDVEKVTRSFVNFLVKHRVTLCISQDPRNVYSILFTAMIDHPHREENHYFKQTYKYFTTAYRKELQIYEGDIVAISFRGNVDVPDREKLIYSFHGCRGIRRHFDIQVSNPMSQRSLQTYHGALQIFTLKTPRYSGLDRSLAPCNKNGWELSAEFPLLLPKYLKSTPVIINKAPVSLRFHEPLTVDFIRTICSELVNEWTKFAKALGISHARVQAIKQQHRNQVSDKVLMDVMINWMKTQRISQDKVTPLINALRLCNRPKLASELAQRYSAQKVSRTKTTRDKGLQKAFSVIGKSSSVIARWRQLLLHLCQNEGNHVVDVTKEIDEKYNDEVTKCQNALTHWKTTTTAPSVWTLVDALRASRCDIVADTIVTMESKRKQPETK